MFGPLSRNGKRIISAVTQNRSSARTRLRRLKVALATSPVLFFTLGGTIGEQDIFALINARKDQSPRWMMALEPANFATKITPKLALGTPAVPDYTSVPILTLTSAERNVAARPVYGLEDVVASVRPISVPDTIETNTSSKGDRLVTVAPDRQMVDRAAGNIYAMSSLISNEKKHEDLPRVAFVKPQPLDSKETSRLAEADKNGLLEGGPLDLQKVMMARNAAARFVEHLGRRDVATEIKRHTRWEPAHGDVDRAMLPDGFELEQSWTAYPLAIDTLVAELDRWVTRWDLDVRGRGR